MGDRAGGGVSGAGDVDGDGLPDFVIASGLAEARYPSRSGAAYVVFGPEVGPPRFRRGEVNQDGELNLTGGVRLLRSLFAGGAEPPCLDAADADDSGDLELTDGIVILRFLFTGGVAPAAPGPSACGVDPTGDDLGCATAPEDCL